MKTRTRGSLIDQSYSSGEYFADAGRHGQDAEFKAANFLRLFDKHRFKIRSYADIGCGSGAAVKRISQSLKSSGCQLEKVCGYDVSPHVKDIESGGVEFIHADFCLVEERFDLVTLFDVFEHVPDPVSFIRQVAARCDLIGFHIPLDNSINVAARDMFRAKLRKPGHLIFLDTAQALNLLAYAGLRVIDYEYTFTFLAPLERKSLSSKIAFPFRLLLSKLSPWFLSKTFGGASLMVIAQSISE